MPSAGAFAVGVRAHVGAGVAASCPAAHPVCAGGAMPAGHPRFRRASSCPHEVWGGPTAGTTAVVGSPLGIPVASDCYLRDTSALSHRIPGGQGVVASENGVKEGTRARPSRVRIWHGPRGRCVTIGGSPARLEKRDSGSSVAGRVWPAGRGEGKHQFVCIESLLTSGAGSAARAGARGESCIDTYYFGDSVPIDRDDPRANPPWAVYCSEMATASDENEPWYRYTHIADAGSGFAVHDICWKAGERIPSFTHFFSLVSCPDCRARIGDHDARCSKCRDGRHTECTERLSVPALSVGELTLRAHSEPCQCDHPGGHRDHQRPHRA
jgi:hypothetical protein